MLLLESSLAQRDNPEILGKWQTRRTVLTDRKFPTEISGIFFIYAKQPTFRESWLWANKQLVKNSKLLEAQQHATSSQNYN